MEKNIKKNPRERSRNKSNKKGKTKGIKNIKPYNAPIANSFFDSKPIFSYAYNSYEGKVRSYNEDRICISVNHKIDNNENTFHFFSIFDGHGGSKCADFLKSNFLHYLTKNKYFPKKISKALRQTFIQMEKLFYQQNKPLNLIDEYEHSGSCALIILIYKSICYCANVGDSRALYSESNSKIVKQLNIEHKPENRKEKERIEQAGGKVYKNTTSALAFKMPWRIDPGKLSVIIFYK